LHKHVDGDSFDLGELRQVALVLMKWLDGNSSWRW
jgi:hypothetical protein